MHFDLQKFGVQSLFTWDGSVRSPHKKHICPRCPAGSGNYGRAAAGRRFQSVCATATDRTTTVVSLAGDGNIGLAAGIQHIIATQGKMI